MEKEACKYKHAISFKSAYEQYQYRLAGQPWMDSMNIDMKVRGYPPYSNFTPDFKSFIDYIFYHGERMKLLKVLKIPPQHMLEYNGEKGGKGYGLPNDIFPSDHVRMEAVIQMN